MNYFFPLAGTMTTLLHTTPEQRKEKGWKPIAILASFAIPINIFRIQNPHPPVNKYTISIALFGSCIGTGIQWCAGRQFGYILGQVMDKYQVKPT
jgi:hypothetical protein